MKKFQRGTMFEVAHLTTGSISDLTKESDLIPLGLHLSGVLDEEKWDILLG